MSEAIKPTLLPCPFCGRTAPTLFKPTCDKYTPYDASHRAFPMVRCSCGVSTSGSDWDESGKTAIAAWNRRSDPLVERVKELEEALRLLVAAEDRIDNLPMCPNTYTQESVKFQLYDAMTAARAALSKALPNTVAEAQP